MSGRCRTAACIGDAWLELGASALLLLALGVLFVATPAVLGVSYSGAEEEVAAAVGLYVGCRAVMSVAGATVFLLREAMVDGEHLPRKRGSRCVVAGRHHRIVRALGVVPQIWLLSPQPSASAMRTGCTALAPSG